MTGLGRLSRIALGLTSLACVLLMLLDVVGLIPDEADRSSQARAGIAEALVAHTTLSVMMDDLSGVRSLLEVSMRRNPEIESVGLRDRRGRVLMATRDHARFWTTAPETGSSISHTRMPIYKEGAQWATLEIAFSPPTARTVLGAVIARPATRITLAFAGMAFFANLLFMRRILRHLDPSEVVPTRVQTALDVMSDGVLLVDPDERVVVANSAMCDLLDRPPAALVGLHASSLDWQVDGRPAGRADFPWLDAIENAQTRADVPLAIEVDGDAGLTELRVTGSPVLDGWNRAKGAIVTFRDVTELERQRRELERAMNELEKSQDEIRLQNEELEVLAQTDALTGIANRGTFMTRYEQAFEQAQKSGETLCCLMVDIDFFKRVNDEHGHSVGDEVIRAVANALTQQTRSTDIVGRYGGEEFAIALPGAEPDIAMEVAERIRASIAAPGFTRVPTSVSIGLSSSGFGASSPAALLDEADSGLYASKENGRNRVTRYDAISSQPGR